MGCSGETEIGNCSHALQAVSGKLMFSSWTFQYSIALLKKNKRTRVVLGFLKRYDATTPTVGGNALKHA